MKRDAQLPDVRANRVKETEMVMDPCQDRHRREEQIYIYIENVENALSNSVLPLVRFPNPFVVSFLFLTRCFFPVFNDIERQ